MACGPEAIAEKQSPLSVCTRIARGGGAADDDGSLLRDPGTPPRSRWQVAAPARHPPLLRVVEDSHVGGKVPGSLPTDAREIFEEGIRVPPLKIFKNDELQTDVLDLILHNSRMPTWNRSDFNALVAAMRTAEKRVIEMAAKV